MTLTPGRSPLKPEELAAIFGADDDTLREIDALEAKPARRRAARRRVSLADRLRRIPKWAIFVAGLAIGWLVIGWWLWPVRWTNSDPWEMSLKNQKAYVQLVADRYWYARDLAQAESALDGWNREEVNTLLAALQAETIDADTRQRLDALTQALSLPGGEQSLLESIFSQEGIIFALIIATLPMLIAIGLVVVSRVRFGAPSAAADELASDDQEADLEELLADVQLDEGLTIGGGPGPEGAPTEPQEPGQENKPEEKQPGEEEPEEEEEEEEALDQNNPLGDLASLFAEEDTSLASLEALCKGLPDVSVDDLLNMARTISRRFKEERRKSAGG